MYFLQAGRDSIGSFNSGRSLSSNRRDSMSPVSSRKSLNGSPFQSRGLLKGSPASSRAVASPSSRASPGFGAAGMSPRACLSRMHDCSMGQLHDAYSLLCRKVTYIHCHVVARVQRTEHTLCAHGPIRDYGLVCTHTVSRSVNTKPCMQSMPCSTMPVTEWPVQPDAICRYWVLVRIAALSTLRSSKLSCAAGHLCCITACKLYSRFRLNP